MKRGGFCLRSPGENILSLSGWVGLLQIPLQDRFDVSTAWKALPKCYHIFRQARLLPDKPQLRTDELFSFRLSQFHQAGFGSVSSDWRLSVSVNLSQSAADPSLSGTLMENIRSRMLSKQYALNGLNI